MKKVEDLKIRLLSQNADFEIIHLDKPIKSKSDALGYFRIEETVPTLIIQTEEAFYALIISGERSKVNFDLIKNFLGCERVGMAEKSLVVEQLGFEPGQVPLIGHELPCIIDNRIFKYSYVYGGTGDLYHTLKINPNDLVKANNVIFRFD